MVETDDLGDVTTITWTYDALGRLVSEVSASDNDDRDYADTFTYDLASNRLAQGRSGTPGSAGDFETTYSYDANDRLEEEVKDMAGTTTGDTNTVYAYDGTTQTSKTVREGTTSGGGNRVTVTTFGYDATGRMTQTIEEKYVSDTLDTSTQTDYVYDDSGFRVKQTVAVDGGTAVVTEFLADRNNHTGYTQVLEESVDGVLHKTFTLGHDVLTQADSAAVATGAAIHHLLYDGHGSTRAVLDAAADIVQQYAYTAYGVMLDSAALTTAATALTQILYSGEWTNANGQQYLRARWYDPASGRFNRLDPFAGNTRDPQSLHKYLYTHGNPIMGIDPSGMFFSYIGQLAKTSIEQILQRIQLPTLHLAKQGAKQFVRTAARRALEEVAFQYFVGNYIQDSAQELALLSIELAGVPLGSTFDWAITAYNAIDEAAAYLSSTASSFSPLRYIIGQAIDAMPTNNFKQFALKALTRVISGYTGRSGRYAKYALGGVVATAMTPIVLGAMSDALSAVGFSRGLNTGLDRLGDESILELPLQIFAGGFFPTGTEVPIGVAGESITAIYLPTIIADVRNIVYLVNTGQQSEAQTAYATLQASVSGLFK